MINQDYLDSLRDLGNKELLAEYNSVEKRRKQFCHYFQDALDKYTVSQRAYLLCPSDSRSEMFMLKRKAILDDISESFIDKVKISDYIYGILCNRGVIRVNFHKGEFENERC